MPVIALTGYLGAGKTTVLNHLLQTPGARIGVVVNDFGTINIDAALVRGQVDEPASIAGGCLCCMPDAGGLDDALGRLTNPRLRLDAVLVEASGVAEPAALAGIIRTCDAATARPGGLIDVVDAAAYLGTVDDDGPMPPVRFAAASLVVINEVDRLPPGTRASTIARITARVRERNPGVCIVETDRGRLDPALVLDVADTADPADELPLAGWARHVHETVHHEHADAVTVPVRAPVDAGRLADLLDDPPEGVYRLKGRVLVRTANGPRGRVLDLVGRQAHVTTDRVADGAGALVAIGMHLDTLAVRTRLEQAVSPATGLPATGTIRRLSRYR
ncbi:GTP-binding protein [Brooklawnia cerclae]